MACYNAKPDILPNLCWIMDRVFKFTNFGVVSVLHRDFFVQAVSQFNVYFIFSRLISAVLSRDSSIK